MKYTIAMWGSIIISTIHFDGQEGWIDIGFGYFWLAIALIYGFMALKEEK